MRVDVNADDVLDWNEFLTYMLLEKDHTSRTGEEAMTRTLAISSVQPTISDKNVKYV